MKIGDAFQGINKVFLDTAPVIYYVEATPGYAVVAQEVFKLLSQGGFEAVVSPVTLARLYPFLRNPKPDTDTIVGR